MIKKYSYKHIFNRRDILKTVAGAGAFGVAHFSSPSVHANKIKKLRYVSSGVNAHISIAEQAYKEIGVEIEYISMPIGDLLASLVTNPNSFDIIEAPSMLMKQIFPMGRIRPLDVSKLTHYNKLSSILTSNHVGGNSLDANGISPASTIFASSEQSYQFSKDPTNWITMFPTVYNADTLGVNDDVAGDVKHWGALLDPAFKGRTSLIDAPGIGIIDAALAIESRGDMRYGDKGNMTRAEIKQTIEILIENKKSGQFYNLWHDFNQSTQNMLSGKVIIQSMWLPAVVQIRQNNLPCRYNTLQEGNRGWSYGLSLPINIEKQTEDAAYDFINWFSSGWVGAKLQRQGYYSAIMDTARQYMNDSEWGFWVDGQPAKYNITSCHGHVIEKSGAIRDGGEHDRRMGSLSCWNSIMDETRYLIRQWQRLRQA
jgi:putative spermidine/putrescine transport system substrate-binding protein